MSEPDFLIAGAGHNSLITAAYLAQAGLRVQVLEARDAIGGDTITEELTLPGFHHDSCSSAHVLIQNNPLLRENELGLDRYGLEYLFPDPALVIPFNDGESITMYRDRERTAAEFARFSPRDGRAYLELLADWDSVKATVNAGNQRAPRKPSEALAALEATAKGMEMARVRASTAWDVVCERFEAPHTRAFLLWMAMMTAQPIDRPYSGFLPFSLTSGRQAYSWTTPRGGSGMLPQALAAYITERGGVIETGRWVERAIIEGGRVVGLRTRDGSEYRARRGVVSTIHLKHLPEVVGAQALGAEFMAGVDRWKAGITFFATHYALSEAPRYRTHDGSGVSSVAMGAAGSAENLLAACQDFRAGRLHLDDPMLLVVNSSVADPSRAPEGKHTLKVISYLPYELPEGPEHWDTIKNEVSDRLLAHLRTLAPNLTDDVILARHVESPLDMERRNPHNWHGSCHGGDQDPAQEGYLRPMPGYSQYRSPVPGLYMTGGCTHPGGSVSGAPGRNAAHAILADLGLSAAKA
ncbi:MAG TPA: NAD(P)/FAD-dependent oxidoreductase [Ktedonobacterales bacterium]